VEVVYGIGGGLVADAAKYIGWKNNLPTVIVPTALSVDGFFTALVAVREAGTVGYETTGPAERVIIDWDVVSSAPPQIRGTGIVEILSIVTGLLDWRYAAERNQTTPGHPLRAVGGQPRGGHRAAGVQDRKERREGGWMRCKTCWT
jgi:glycerol-1-phosphate dehydrogenase [NAD(P)+]